MRTVMMALLALGLAGCDQDQFQYSGFQMVDFFPLEGDVTGWTFGNVDPGVDYRLIRTLTPEEDVNPESRGDGLVVWTWSVEAVCVEDTEDCAETGWQYDLSLSSSSRRGVLIHGYERPDTGFVAFDPPLELAESRMALGDATTTDNVDGHSFTSTLVGLEDCEDTLAVDWECAHLSITSEPEGHWLTGDWWATAGFNIVAFERQEDPGKWRIIRNPERPSTD
jgi:hypothetical protein